jgi:hypothetical protein
MLRGLILLLLATGVAIVALPFVMASRALDSRGVALSGRVYHKSETVRIRYSGWEVNREVTIEYPVPETGGVSFFGVLPTVEQYDALHTRQPVEVRYLLRRDVPNLPLSHLLRDMHALPMVRLASIPARTLISPAGTVVLKVMGGLLALLVLWRITRSSFMGWTLLAGAVVGLGWLFLQDFPRRTPDPAVAVQRASGKVQSIDHIDRLFSGSRTRGLDTDQPIDVVAVEFVPQGRSEPVVAVDLIDRGSVGGLKERSIVPIRYEAGSPRTAYIDGATRTFPERNFRGSVLQAALWLAVLLVGFGIAHVIGKGFRRLIAR